MPFNSSFCRRCKRQAPHLPAFAEAVRARRIRGNGSNQVTSSRARFSFFATAGSPSFSSGSPGDRARATVGKRLPFCVKLRIQTIILRLSHLSWVRAGAVTSTFSPPFHPMELNKSQRARQAPLPPLASRRRGRGRRHSRLPTTRTARASRRRAPSARHGFRRSALGHSGRIRS